jgi:hypothetical protein
VLPLTVDRKFVGPGAKIGSPVVCWTLRPAMAGVPLKQFSG